jgi:hypothetical protein
MGPTARFAALAATAAALVAGCSSTSSGGESYAGADRDAQTPRDAAPDAADSRDGGGPGRDAAGDGPICAVDQKRCWGECVPLGDPVYGCGPDTCTPCIFAQATATCTGDACAIKACGAGYADCNKEQADGCETDVTTATDCGSCGHACPLPDQCHELGACDPSSGTCPVLQRSDGSPCVVGNSCTSGDVCTGGMCGGSAPCPTNNCGASLSAFDGSSTPGWTFNGVAAYDATANTALLVPDGQQFSAGSVFYDDALAADTFTVSFDFRMTTTGGTNTRGDGIAFVMQTGGPTALGLPGGGLGFVGDTGYAAELDIYDNSACGDANDNHAGIDTTQRCGVDEPAAIATSANLIDASPTGGVGDLGDAQWRTATVSLANSALSLAITGPGGGTAIAVPGLQNVALPGLIKCSAYYLGFSAGGGSLAAREEIRNVKVTFPSARCL